MDSIVLEIVEGPDRGRQVCGDTVVELGRDRSIQGALTDEQVSRRHARVIQGEGGLLVEDLDSTNGTFVNDRPVAGHQLLAPGDQIRVGLTVIAIPSADGDPGASAVALPPQITQVGAEVLRPPKPDELPESPPPGLVAAEQAPGFISDSAIGAALGGSHDAALPPAKGAFSSDDLARLVDTRVKFQTNRAAFALLGFAALVVIVVLGSR